MKQVKKETKEKNVKNIVKEEIKETIVPNVVEEEVKENEEEEFDPEKVIEDFSEAAKKIDEKVTNTTTVEELKETLENELKRAENVEEKILKEIEKGEAELTPKQKEVLNNLTNNKSKFVNYWNGVSEGWFN